MVVFASALPEGTPSLKVSARAFGARCALGPALASAARRAGGVGGGHGSAAGARIPACGLDTFLEGLDAALAPGAIPRF
jgi:nanoRNase/pAp phosphatase (c-di-AMP/oligoRNAs hydrolase)